MQDTDLISDRMAAAERAQSAIDRYFEENNMGVADIEVMLDEHMRTPYRHSQE